MVNKIALVAGARPNFMKISPLYHLLQEKEIPFFLLNTGQHFDEKMSRQFLREFDIKPHYSLRPAGGSVISQMVKMMSGIETVFDKESPAIVIVVGDVNSTLAAALVASKMKIPLAHVEAGLRSRNKMMAEEINRILVDQLADLLFVTEKSGINNLKKENVRGKLFLVGNIMMDTLSHFARKIPRANHDFYFCTLHRAENVDEKKVLIGILDALELIAADATVYFPLHPRTAKMAKKFGLLKRIHKIFTVLEPLSYTESVFYQKNARLVLTDSGGIQEETTFLGTPCITLRNETERPVTVRDGTNSIGGITKSSILAAYKRKNMKRKKVTIPLWDGRAASRIVKVVQNYLT